MELAGQRNGEGTSLDMKAKSRQNRDTVWVLGGAVLLALTLHCVQFKTVSHSQSGATEKAKTIQLFADGTESNGGSTNPPGKPIKQA